MSSAAKASSAMSRAILSALPLPINKVMDKWVEEGNEVTRSEVHVAMAVLRKRKMFVKALQVSCLA